MPHATRLCVTVSALSVGLTALAGAVAPAATAGTPAADQASGVERGIETVPPIATIEAADGVRWPEPLPSVGVLPSASIRSGSLPTLHAPALISVDTKAFRVIDLRTARREQVAAGSFANGWATLSTTLDAGGLYDIEIQDNDDAWVSTGRVSVAVAGGSGGAPIEVGGLEVDSATGSVSTSWVSRPIIGPLGSAVVRLAWASGLGKSPGVPEGWRVVPATGSSWAHLLEDGQSTEAVDVPGRPVATFPTKARDAASVRFAFPSDEMADVRGFVIAAKAAGKDWTIVKRLGRSFALPNVDALVSVIPGKRPMVRIGARVEGTIVWGPAARVRRGDLTARADMTTAGHLAGAGVNSVLTAGELPDTVTLIGWDASRLNFVRNGLGVYQQVGGTAGFRNSLTSVAAGVWEFTDTQGFVTRFERGRATEVWTNGKKVSTASWTADGRVSSIANEIGRTISLRYADQGPCDSAEWVSYGYRAPGGTDLCAVTYPDGRESLIGYVRAGEQAQIALIKDPGNEGASWGWDTQGRLVATRTSLVNRVATIDPTAAGVIARVEYDAQGRAATAIEQPPAPSEPSVTYALDFPAISAASLRAWLERPSASEAVPATVTVSVAGQSLSSRTSSLDPTTLQPLSIKDAAGRSVSRRAPTAVSPVRSMTDVDGRVTTYTYNDLGLVTKTQGPSTTDEAMTLTSSFDTERSGDRDRPLNGLRMQVYPRSGFSGTPTPEFWRADYSRGALSATWEGRAESTSLQGAAVWTPSDADDAAGSRDGWQFDVRSAGGTTMTFMVGSVACTSTPCVLRNLPKGPKSVTIQVDNAGSDGWFSVEVAPVGGSPAKFATDEVTPGYARVTVATSNDDLPGGPVGSVSRYTFADMALGLVASETGAGGLDLGYGYEEDGWRRLTSVTSPGGRVQTTTYWGNDEATALPSLCGGQTVRQSGQPKTVVRRDGTSTTSYYDITGSVRAIVTTGADGVSETTCMTYTDADFIASVSLFDSSGALVEESTTTYAVGGDARVTAMTLTHGPGVQASAGTSVTTTRTIDLAGRTVSAVGIGGETTTTQYDSEGNVASRTVTPPQGTSGTPLVFTYAYRASDGLLQSVAVNGVPAAAIDYEEASGRIASIDYAGAVSVGYDYLPNGQTGTLVVSAPGTALTRITDAHSVSDFGRILSTSTTALGSGSFSEERGYVYDSAGRLVRASMTVGSVTTRYDYAFDKAQSAECASSGYVGLGDDGLRTGGVRDGASFVQCFDDRGRLVSTTDPLVTGGGDRSDVTHDELARVVNISGARAAAMTWMHGTTLHRVVEIAGDGSGLVDTRMSTFGGQIREKTVTTDSGTDTVRYAGPFFIDVEDGALGATRAVTYDLPGGAHVTTAPGAKASLTLPGIAGEALVTYDLPALALGAAAAPGPSVGLASRYGPYGEPRTMPSLESDALPSYAWQADKRQETLPGTSSITLMGARPYHAPLGMFLAPDPVIASGTNAYTYTGGDPVNSHDSSGRTSEDNSQWLWIGAGIGAALLGGAAFFAGGRMLFRANGTARELSSLGAAFRVKGTAAVAGLVAVGGAGAAGYGTYLAVKSATDSDAAAISSAVGASLLMLVGAGYAAMPMFNRVRKLSQRKNYVPVYSPFGVVKEILQRRREAREVARSVRSSSELSESLVDSFVHSTASASRPPGAGPSGYNGASLVVDQKRQRASLNFFGSDRGSERNSGGMAGFLKDLPPLD